MDRLEKALEKSRQLREAALRTAKGQPASAVPLAATYATPSFASDLSKLDEALLERNRIVAHRTRSKEADLYKLLRTQILQLMDKQGFRTLAITSPDYGDGKTTVALNLAISITLDLKQTVLLVDLDLRKPSLHECLGFGPTAGLTNHLMNNAPLSECLVHPPFERLSVLPVGTAHDNSSELLGSPKMTALAQELKTRYNDRIIIYDMPPVLAQDDPIAFLPQVDAVLVVVRDGITTKEKLKRCLNTLSHANVVGTVLNNCW